MLSTQILIILLIPILLFLACIGYLTFRYVPIVSRIFEEKPLFHPLRLDPPSDGEDVVFPSMDGTRLHGTYLHARTQRRKGVIVFCHEFLSDRWSFQPYINHLRDEGFDLFTLDFCHHGESDDQDGYEPLQWVTRHEVRDLRAALAYLWSRADRDEAGFGLFGVSRGGSTALCVAANDSRIWGVVTDGAFPTHGTMMAYIRKWSEIYIHSESIFKLLPSFVFHYLAWAGRVRSQTRLGCRYPHVEHAVRRLAPRPWLAIHGERDVYIGPEIARSMFEQAGEPKALWLVPGAKHNQSRLVDPEGYAARISQFYHDHSPRLMGVSIEHQQEAALGRALTLLPSTLTVSTAR